MRISDWSSDVCSSDLPRVTYAVYEGLLRNIADYGAPTTVFAAISDRTDVDVLNQLLDDYSHPKGVEIRYMYQRGDGKRSAMARSEEHTSELKSLMRISYAVLCLKKKNSNKQK